MLKRWSLCSSTQLIVWPGELGCGLRGTPDTAEFTTLMQVIVLTLAYRCRQRLSRWLYQRWPALAGKGRSALSPAEPLPARKAKILLAVLYFGISGVVHWQVPLYIKFCKYKYTSICVCTWFQFCFLNGLYAMLYPLPRIMIALVY